MSAGLVLWSAMLPDLKAQQAAPQQQQQTAQQRAGTTSPTKPAAPQATVNDTTGNPGLPQAPQPTLTDPLYLRDTGIDYTRLKKHTLRNPFAPYTATAVPAPRLTNTPKLDDLLRDGKLYLSLSDAVTLALENNYDIAIARLNLDIADTDVLRTEAGANFRGVSTGLVTNTQGGTSTTISGGGGPGGTSRRFRRSRHRRKRPGVEHERWRSGSIQLRPADYRHERVQPHDYPLFQFAFAELDRQYVHQQYSLRAGIQYRHLAGCGLQQLPADDEQRVLQLLSFVRHDIPGNDHAALAARIRSQAESSVYRRGEEQPQDYRFRISAAGHLHGDAGGEHLLVAGQRVRGRAGEGACAASSPRS